MNPTGQALEDLIHDEQNFWQKRYGGYKIKHGKHAEEQGKGKNTETNQNTLLKRISLLTTALSETTPLQPQDRIKGATKKALQGLGFLHLRPTFQKLVREPPQGGNRQSRKPNSEGKPETE